MRRNKRNSVLMFDRSIIMTIAMTSAIGLLVMGYKLLTHSDCSGTGFMVAERQLVAGQIASFKAQSPEATEWEWNFGDESPPVGGEEALHVFRQPGEYWVTLQIEGGCVSRRKVKVRKSEPLVNSRRYPAFNMPATARVGETIRFIDRTEGATEWQWSFGETMQVDATTKEPTYVFKSSGVKTVTLIVNGNERYAAKKRITVFARPVEKPEFDLDPPERVKLRPGKTAAAVSISEVPQAPPLTPLQESMALEISRIQLEDYILQVAEKKREPGSLRPFCCEGFNTRVRANGEEKSLQELLQNLRGKKVTIKNLEVVKLKESRCIDFIKIDYKRKKVLGIF